MKTENENLTSEAESSKSPGFKLSAFSSSLKIGFDGKRALQNFTGLGNYSRYIIELLSEYYPDNNYEVYCPKISENPETDYLKKLKSVTFHAPEKTFFKSLWRSSGIIKDLKQDDVQIYHGLSNEIPFGIKKAGIKSIVTTHDLIFLRFPDYYPWFDRQFYTIKFKYACRNADRIIAISEQTKRDIIEYFGIPGNRIEVIYQNCSSIFMSPVSAEEKKRIALTYNLPEKYLLNVGTIESRKNALLIVKALKELPEDIHLVFIGKETPYAREVKDYVLKNDLEDQVHFLKNIPFTDLPGIYQQAEIFVYPSKFEGFGIPVIEALHSNVPVIAAKGSCLEEAGGPNSVYIDPEDEDDLTDAISYILNHPEEKQKMISLGAEFVKKFSNPIIAKKIIETYQTTITDVKR